MDDQATASQGPFGGMREVELYRIGRKINLTGDECPKKGNSIKVELSKIEKSTQAKPARKSMKLSDLFSSPRPTTAEPVVKEEDY